MTDLDTFVVNELKAKLDAGRTCLIISIRTSKFVELPLLLKAAGYDGFFADLEHGQLTMAEAGQICVAGHLAGVTGMVRLPGQSAFAASSALDAGAMGLIAPHTHTAKDVALIIDAAFYPPLGNRSTSSTLPQLGFLDWPMEQAMARLNSQTLLIPQIESEEGVANAAEIAALPGVGALIMGMNDLTSDIGIAGQVGHDRALRAIETCQAAAAAHGKHFGVAGIPGPLSLLKTVHQMGARLISTGVDTGSLLSAFKQKAKELRAFES